MTTSVFSIRAFDFYSDKTPPDAKRPFFSGAVLLSVGLHSLVLALALSVVGEDHLRAARTTFDISIAYEEASDGDVSKILPARSEAPFEQPKRETEPLRERVHATAPEPSKSMAETLITPVETVIIETKKLSAEKEVAIVQKPAAAPIAASPTEAISAPVTRQEQAPATQNPQTAPSKIAQTSETHLPKYTLGSAENPKPDYPVSARRRGWQGKVMLGVTVGDDGLTEAVTIVDSSGYPILDQAALTTIRDRWVFSLAYVPNAIISNYVTVPISFEFE